MDKEIGIYKITNIINGKVYIGQSRCISKRWKNHRITAYNSNSVGYDYPLYRAIRKYGIENFQFEVVEICTLEELNDKEKYWISYYNSYKEGYNQNEGGSSAPYFSKLNQEQVNEIIECLINTDISEYKIAEKYSVDQSFISNINCGKHWVMDGLSYPLRKRGLENFCIDCGTKIYNGSIRCVKCAGKVRQIVARPSRQELKDLIFTTPFTLIGEKFGVTDNAIRKWCKAENLPYKKKDISLYTEEEWENI